MISDASVRERPLTELDSRWNATLLSGYRDVLELTAGGAAPGEILNALVRLAQGITRQPSRAAIFVLDAAAAKLHFRAAAGLSAEYTQAVDGFAVSPTMPSCGSAAYTGQAVIVEDVGRDPLWAPYVELARKHGIAACWSFPMRRGNEVLGTFALYQYQPCRPDDAQYAEVEYLASIASLVLQRETKANGA